MAAKNVLDRIKEDMESFVGKRVRLKANQGRKKVIEVEGILESTYPKVFIIKLNEKPGSEKRVSFTYADVLTEAVELSVYSKDKEKRIGCAGL